MYNILYNILLILQYSAKVLRELWLYVLLGVFLGELLKFTSWRKIIYKYVTRSPIISTLSAVVLGMVSPLCTYGTVPVAVQLFRAGVPLAPLIAFLSASSMMNPQLFIFTVSGLGLEMAVLRITVIALFASLLGFALYRIPTAWIANPRIKEMEKKELHYSKKSFTVKALLVNSWESLEFVGFYMIIGILAGAVIDVLMRGQWIIDIFPAGRWYSVLLASLLGVPLYACGGGTIPLVSELIKNGMSKGSALAFLTVGSATRPTPLMALASILRPVFIVVYVLALILFSMAIGMFYK